nr:MAG TPA: hypothetical protein [Caudoviricetes sp.]
MRAGLERKPLRPEGLVHLPAMRVSNEKETTV